MATALRWIAAGIAKPGRLVHGVIQPGRSAREVERVEEMVRAAVNLVEASCKPATAPPSRPAARARRPLHQTASAAAQSVKAKKLDANGSLKAADQIERRSHTDDELTLLLGRRFAPRLAHCSSGASRVRGRGCWASRFPHSAAVAATCVQAQLVPRQEGGGHMTWEGD
jgi:hypothetical protein